MDSARRMTDQQISAMRREFAADYDSLGGSMSVRLSEYLSHHVDEDGLVEATALTGQKWARMRDQLAREVTEVNSSSMRTLDGRLGEVRALTAEGSPSRSPFPHPAIDQRADVAWNRRKVEAVARQGIGRTPAEAGERMRRVADMNSNATARRVRTAVNGAENAGRLDAMLARGGSKRWITMADERVRDSHAALHGKVVPVDEPFDNGLMFPGDPSGPPEEVYNCRCVLEWVNDAEDTDWTEDLEPEEGVREVVEGQDISDTWQRRPDQFDFEIEDVLDAQGFDGLPRVVDADEFDQAVGAANGGNGLVMQRTYSAPDQATLDAYRDQLYSGKWYVDCSTGGAQYGQGMYAAADYTGKLSAGIESEMEHYIDLGRQRNPITTFDMLTDARKSEMVDESIRSLGLSGDRAEAAKTMMNYELKIGEFDFNEDWGKLSAAHEKLMDVDYMSEVARLRTYRSEPVHYVETMTLDPSARIISYDRLINDFVLDYDTDINDVGAYAVAKGYDAINAEGHGASGSYTVVLNRTKLIIRRP